jgi:phosphate/sulfate permease
VDACAPIEATMWKLTKAIIISWLVGVVCGTGISYYVAEARSMLLLDNSEPLAPISFANYFRRSSSTRKFGISAVRVTRREIAAFFWMVASSDRSNTISTRFASYGHCAPVSIQP